MAFDTLTKFCRECGKEKPLLEFPSRHDRPGYYGPDCNECYRILTKKRRDARITTIGYIDKPEGIVGAKKCRGPCGEVKSLEEFHWLRDQGIFRAQCKNCYGSRRTALRDPEDNRRRVREWIKANPEKRRVQSKRNHENRRADVGRWLASNLRTTRAYCKRKRVPIDITVDYLLMLYRANAGCCALTGRELIFGSKGQQRDSISVDRIEPAKGYVQGNVRLITHQANMARGMFDDTEFDALCEARLAFRDAVRLAETAD